MGIRERWLIDNERKEVEVRSFETDATYSYKVGESVAFALSRPSEVAVENITLQNVSGAL